jgi:steroid 5-alpha reductase family enzyme
VSAVAGPTPTVLLPIFVVGVALWGVGVFFEAVGDHQLRRFKADPANRGTVMDRGLWAWTRHPNYFGDACVWWGLWLASIASWISLLTVLSPVLMTYFLIYATGARLLEKHMVDRPGFREYCSRTSFFIPKPPRLRIS